MNYKIIDNNKDRYMLFLHCICGNTKIFVNQFEILSKYYNFILVDFPAHGNNRTTTSDFSFESISYSIINILKNEGIKKVDIIGLSLGSMILDDLILLAPKGMINKVIFTSTLIGFPFDFINYIFNFFVKIIKLFPRCIYMKVITYLMLPLKRDKIQREKYYRNSLKMSKEVLVRYFNIMNDYIKRSNKKDFKYLKNYCNDYLFICGNIDLFFIRVKKNLENSPHLIIIPKASHLCNLKDCDVYNKFIVDYLNSNNNL